MKFIFFTRDGHFICVNLKDKFTFSCILVGFKLLGFCSKIVFKCYTISCQLKEELSFNKYIIHCIFNIYMNLKNLSFECDFSDKNVSTAEFGGGQPVLRCRVRVDGRGSGRERAAEGRAGRTNPVPAALHDDGGGDLQGQVLQLATGLDHQYGGPPDPAPVRRYQLRGVRQWQGVHQVRLPAQRGHPLHELPRHLDPGGAHPGAAAHGALGDGAAHNLRQTQGAVRKHTGGVQAARYTWVDTDTS